MSAGPLLPVVLVLLAGVGVAFQPPTNAALARAGGSVTLAALTSFAIGTAVLALAWTAFDRTPVTALKGAPAWAWMGGLYGAAFVAIFAYAAPRLGVASALTLATASQVAAALAVDHLGLLELDRTPVSATRLAGAALVIAGALLVRRG